MMSVHYLYMVSSLKYILKLTLIHLSLCNDLSLLPRPVFYDSCLDFYVCWLFVFKKNFLTAFAIDYRSLLIQQHVDELLNVFI